LELEDKRAAVRMPPMVSLLQKAHVSRVNARHLLDDFVGSYTHSPDVTVIVEDVANALDAGARQIAFTIDQDRRVLGVEDDGRGMTAEEFERYHDLAQSSKQRGTGIGFAGLGAKLAHNITSKVVTETRSPSYHAASEWGWKGEDLQWKYVRRNELRAPGARVEFHEP
jgi:hypothetical protein